MLPILLALLASLLVLLPYLRRGLASLRTTDTGGAWLVGAGVHLLALLIVPLEAGLASRWEGLAAGCALVPLVVLAGVAGIPAGRGRRTVLPALGLALAGSVFALSGPVQVFLLPEAPPAAGRTHRLAQALDAATEAAGDEGWIGLDLWPDLDLTALRLADRARGRTVGRTRDRPARDDAAPRLELLPLPELPAGAAVGVVTRFAPEILEVSTEGGSGIYLRTPTARYGPWLVLHVTRP